MASAAAEQPGREGSGHRATNAATFADEAAPLTAASAPLRGARCQGTLPLKSAFGAPGTAPASVLERAWRAAASGGAVIALSAAMILFNKRLMRPEVFPYPPVLTSLQMLGSLCLSSVLLWLAPWLFPAAPVVFAGAVVGVKDGESQVQGFRGIRVGILLQALRPFAMIALGFTLSLVSGNWAYGFAPVSFLQMIKESHVGIIYAFSVLAGLEPLRLRSVLLLAFVAVCAAVSITHQVQPSCAGFFLQMLAGVGGATQIVLMNKLMSESGGPRVDPLTAVLCLAPTTLVALVPVSVAFWDANTLPRLLRCWQELGLNVVLAFALQVTTAVCIQNLQGVGHALVSILKDVLIVFAASRLLHEQLAPLQICGFVGAILGIAAYSSTKIFPELWGDSPVKGSR